MDQLFAGTDITKGSFMACTLNEKQGKFFEFTTFRKITLLLFFQEKLPEVEDVRRFGNRRKLIAYAGLDPSLHQSEKFKGKSKISKRENRHARRAIFLMAQSVARVNHFFRAYFLRQKEEGTSCKKVLLVVACKLIRAIFALLT
jgi:hypothetical protein